MYFLRQNFNTHSKIITLLLFYIAKLVEDLVVEEVHTLGNDTTTSIYTHTQAKSRNKGSILIIILLCRGGYMAPTETAFASIMWHIAVKIFRGYTFRSYSIVFTSCHFYFFLVWLPRAVDKYFCPWINKVASWCRGLLSTGGSAVCENFNFFLVWWS